MMNACNVVINFIKTWINMKLTLRWLMYVYNDMSEVGGSLLRCGMLSGKICEDQR